MISYRHCEHGYTTPCPLCEELGKVENMSAPIGNTDGIRYVKPGEIEKEIQHADACAFNCSRGFHEADLEYDTDINVTHHLKQVVGFICKYCRCFFVERD